LFTRRAQAKRPTRTTTAPRLECLEDRLTPTVIYHGGALLPNVEAQAVYLGSDWSDNPTLNAQMQQLEGFQRYLVDSPYMDMLSKAGYRVGRGTFDQGRVDIADLPGALNADGNINEQAIPDLLQARIDSGDLASPDANRLYMVFLPPGSRVVFSDGSLSGGDGGYHGSFAGHAADGSPLQVRFAVMIYPSNDSDQMAAETATVTHELAEAATDPDPGNQILGDGPDADWGWGDTTLKGEIADIAQSIGPVNVVLNGYWVATVADQNDNVIAPADLSAVGQSFSAFAGQPFSGTVATASDPTLLTQGANLTATISWGDGTSSTGIVRSDNAGNFQVSGSHTWTTTGAYTVTVSLQDQTNTIASATTSTAIQVGVVSPLEGAALQEAAAAYQYGYYEYVYGTHSIYAYNALVFGADGYNLAQEAASTHSAALWYDAYVYEQAAAANAYQDYLTPGSTWASAAFVDYANAAAYSHYNYVVEST
jgi:hypothetical protein